VGATHNPEVVGSNPAPATKHSQALRGLFSYVDHLGRLSFVKCIPTMIAVVHWYRASRACVYRNGRREPLATTYRLAGNYLLRGWDKLPYALVDSRTGGVGFLSKAMMDVLLKCDGTWDFDSPLTASQDREFAAMLLSKGQIERCAPGTGLLKLQRA